MKQTNCYQFSIKLPQNFIDRLVQLAIGHRATVVLAILKIGRNRKTIQIRCEILTDLILIIIPK